jgi:CsoR family transcriptional regulator, copper-sensing transcriptional repressor
VPGYSDRKKDVRRRLSRIEGQVRGLTRMVDDDAYCIDILTQVSAATRALQSVGLMLLEDHLGHCVSDAIASKAPDARARVAEASAAIERMVRS